jgi:hypothetical protein
MNEKINRLITSINDIYKKIEEIEIKMEKCLK